MHSQNNRCEQVLVANSTQKWKEYCAQNTKREFGCKTLLKWLKISIMGLGVLGTVDF